MARIAILISDMTGGGAERVALALIECFLERGHQVDLVLLSAHGELMGLIPSEVKVFGLGVTRFRSALPPIVRYLRSRKPHALQASLWPLTAIAIAAAKLARIRTRVVVSDHITLSKQYGASPGAMAAIKATTRLLYPMANGRVCVSKGSAADLAGLSGLPKQQISVVYNPIPGPPLGAAESADADRLWGAAERRILTVGSLKHQKNHALLIRTFALLDDSARPTLMILGEGGLRAELEQLAGELGVAERVIMPGFAVDPWPFYQSADLFVLSSDYEGFGNVIVEALHAGLPVVSTDCPDGPREILDRGRYGALVPPGDEKALAAAISDALPRTPDRDFLRNRAADFSVERAADAYLDLLLGPGDGSEAVADGKTQEPGGTTGAHGREPNRAF